MEDLDRELSVEAIASDLLPFVSQTPVASHLWVCEPDSKMADPISTVGHVDSSLVVLV